MSKQIKTVTSQRIREEINSIEFIAGLERVIEISLKTGREARFQVGKEIFGERIRYASKIQIGNKVQVGNNEECEKEAKKLFDVRTKSKPNSSETKVQAQFARFMLDNLIGTIPYPPINPELSAFYNPLEENGYVFMDLHTHPNGIAMPSLFEIKGQLVGDIPYLNYIKRDYFKEGIYVNPIMIIVGVTKKEELDLLLMQEKKEKPINGRNELIRAKNLAHFCLSRKRTPEIDSNLYHNLTIATYDRSTKRIRFNRPKSLDQFTYECQAA
jgi:hypothetical protein